MKKFVIFTVLILFMLVNPANAESPIQIDYSDGIYHIVLKGEKIKKKIKFVESEHLITNREAHLNSGAKLTVNAGFFDPENEKAVSYIVSDRQTVSDPLFNENLMSNSFIRKNLNKILNRTEFRVLECDRGKYRYEITPHNAGVDFGCTVITSAQGGPLIVPELKLEEELFIVKEGDKVIRESCSVLHKTARTVIGLKNGEVHLLIITDKNPMDMYEVHTLCKSLGFERAMGFDGGSSTSMNYKNEIEVTSNSDGGGRSLKSFMLVH